MSSPNRNKSRNQKSDQHKSNSPPKNTSSTRSKSPSRYSSSRHSESRFKVDTKNGNRDHQKSLEKNKEIKIFEKSEKNHSENAHFNNLEISNKNQNESKIDLSTVTCNKIPSVAKIPSCIQERINNGKIPSIYLGGSWKHLDEVNINESNDKIYRICGFP